MVTWPNGNDLEVLRYADGEWTRLAATEELLETLPEIVRYRWSYSDGDVLLRRFEDCGWRGISSSDRGGGVTNTSVAEGASLALWDGRPCVAWSSFADPDYRTFVRCHD